jgi:hypothetical protein
MLRLPAYLLGERNLNRAEPLPRKATRKHRYQICEIGSDDSVEWLDCWGNLTEKRAEAVLLTQDDIRAIVEEAEDEDPDGGALYLRIALPSGPVPTLDDVEAADALPDVESVA